MIYRIVAAAWLTLLLAVVGLQEQSHAQFNGCSAGFCSRVAGGAVTTTSWNPVDTDAQTTPSNFNLTLTTAISSFAFSDSRSIASHAAGKYYSEHLIVVDNGHPDLMGIGIFNATRSLTSNFAASGGGESIGYQGDGSVVWCGAAGAIATIQSYVQNDRIDEAADLTNQKMWWRTFHSGVLSGWNNDVLANQNPATNTGGISFSGINTCPGGVSTFFAAMQQLVFSGASQVSTANFGGSYVDSVPATFGNW